MGSFSSMKFYDRQNRFEFTALEWERIKDFKKNISERRRNLYGYCVSCDGESFCLVPFPHLTQVYIYCLCDRISCPTENAFVNVEGVWKYELLKKKRTVASAIFLVDKISRKYDQFMWDIKPEINFSDFQHYLFSGWQDVDPFVAKYLALDKKSVNKDLLRRFIKNDLDIVAKFGKNIIRFCTESLDIDEVLFSSLMNY